MGRKGCIWLAEIKSDNSTLWVWQISSESCFLGFPKSSLTKEDVAIAVLIRERAFFHLSPILNPSLCF